MPERVKLTGAGTSLVLLVRSIKPETVERNEYYLVSDGNKELLVPQSSVKSQLQRLELDTVDAIVGHAMRFGRSTKMSRANKPYWDVDFATPEEEKAAKAAASAASPAPGNPAGAVGAAVPSKSYVDLYDKATQHVLNKVVSQYDAKGFTLTATDVREMVAVLFNAKLKEA